MVYLCMLNCYTRFQTKQEPFPVNENSVLNFANFAKNDDFSVKCLKIEGNF